MAQNTESPYEVTRTGGDGKGYGKVKPEDIALLQEKLFDTLAYFADFCEENGIQYCMVGGTCLGAVRHKDVIPWDDDLDVAVLRADFDKLFRLWEEHGDKEQQVISVLMYRSGYYEITVLLLSGDLKKD